VDGVKHSGIDTDERRNLDFEQLLGQDYQDYLLYTNRARDRASCLLGDDNVILPGDLLYGMLLHSAFKLSDLLLPSVDKTFTLDNETTVAIHSRHSKTKDDGSNVNREVKFLQNMLLYAPRPCRVFAMSDSRALIGILNAATEMGCKISIANHSKFGFEKVSH
jgi:hypothetical protein